MAGCIENRNYTIVVFFLVIKLYRFTDDFHDPPKPGYGCDLFPVLQDYRLFG
jgi:hypothetical protein